MAQIPKGRLEKGSYKPRCRDRAIYFSIAVHTSFTQGRSFSTISDGPAAPPPPPPPTGGYDGQDVWGAPGDREMMTEGYEVVMDFFP